jgi:hypothetical protein
MPANVDDITRDLAALTQRFVDLGAKLGEAARALEEAGAPPSDGLVESLAAARGQFVELRAQALTAAAAAGVPATAEPESLHDLEPLLVSIGEALRARARREALEALQADALAILDRALEIVHRDDPTFAALVGCHSKAHQAREAVLALTEPDSDAAARATAAVQPFTDLLAMVESRDAVDDERYAHLEESVSRGFGRSLAVAAARARLGFAGEIVAPPVPAPEPGPAAATPTLETPPLDLEAHGAPGSVPAAPSIEMAAHEPDSRQPSAPPAAEPEPVSADAAERGREQAPVGVESVALEPAVDSGEPSAPDETAQWWLAAWARWSGWKSSHAFDDAAREELGKYPYLLSVPIQRSPEYEDGLLAYGYSILMDHVEKQKPGCVGNALNSLKPGQMRPVGEQLYDYLISEGRLRETYADFVKSALVAALPEPGLWFQFRVLESREDTRILQRPSARLGDTELSGQRLASDGQRYAEHKFKMTLAPLTARFVLVSADIKEARGAGFKLLTDGVPSDAGWIVTVAASASPGPKTEARRLAEEGTHVAGLGKDYSAAWVAVLNLDPIADHRCELSVFLRKDTRSPFRGKS